MTHAGQLRAKIEHKKVRISEGDSCIQGIIRGQ